jgi:hypothetical protein
MKKFLFSLILLLVSYVGFSQKGLSYQAVILDPNKIEVPGQDISGQPLVNGEVWMKFSIYNGSTLQFEEVHKTRTDGYGLVNLMIGSISTASFNALVWDSSQKSLYVYASFDQGGSYTKISEQKLTYSPYTLFAETAGKLGGTLAISGGGTGATTAADARANLSLDLVNNTSDAAKPVSTATQTALNLKANVTDVTAALALKANTADMNAALDLKASKVTTDSIIALKANTLDVTAALELKSDTSYVLAKVAIATIADADANTKGKIQLGGDLGGTAAAPTVPGLALKANMADVTSALELKANADEVSTSLNSKENATNKSLNVNSDGSSDTKYPSVKAVKDYVDARVQSGGGGTGNITDANANTKGIIQLTGDLSGTAAAPTVPGLALKANTADLTSLTNIVSTNTASITSNISDIITLNTNVASNTASITTNLTALITKAPIASPTFTGIPSAPTAIAGTNTTQLATTEFVTTANAINANLTGDVLSIGNASTVVKINGTSLASLPTGILKNTTSTGIPSVAVAGTDYQTPLVAGTDYLAPNGSAANLTNYPTFNQNTTGNAATATTAGNITATSNTTLTSLSSLNTVGTITSGTWSGTAIAVANGGTGATNAADARTNLGLVIGTNVQAPLVAGTDYLAPNGSAANLTNYPTFNQNTTGNAATSTTAGNITATSNTTLTSLSSLNTVGTITSGTWSGTAIAVANGGTGATNAADARINLGLVIGTNVQAPLVAGTDYLAPNGSAANLTNYPTFNQNTTGNAATATTAGNITATSNTTLTSLSSLNTVGTITSGTWSGTAIAVANGGTGATNAADARTNLGLVIGTNVQAPLVAGTDYLAPNGSAANLTNYPTFNQNTTGNAATATTAGNITATSNTTLTSLSSLNTVGTITSGTWSGTAIAVANGGTGATNTAEARTNLGAEATSNKSTATDLGSTNSSDVLFPTQKAVKTYVDAQTAAAGVSDGSITNIKLAGSIAASKLVGTDITTVGTITSGTWSGTAIAVANGGTGATNAADARTNLGLVIGTNVQAPLVAGTDYLAPNGSAANLTNYPTFNQNTTGNAATATTAGNITATSNTTLTSLSSLNTIGTITSGTWSGTAIAVANGGTGATNAADARTNLGLVIGTNVQAPLVAGTDYLAPNGSAANLTNYPTFNQNTTGNAATATTAGNITATSNTTLTSLSSLNTVGTITSGTWSGTAIAVANGGTGLSTTPTNGQIDIGNGSGFTRATLTAGTAITITNTAGAITIAAAVRPMTEQTTATSTHAVATATFTLSNTPLNSKVWMFINGVRTNNNAYTVSGTTVTYTAANNNSYTIVAGDRIQFDYAY